MPKTYAGPEQVIDPAQHYQATIATGKGDIVIALDPAQAPKTVNNFVFLAREGFYDGLTFHRVVNDFVIQGGCPEGSGTGNPGYRFEDEPVVGEYVAGAVAMANSGPNTNGSQFFVCTVDDRNKLGKQYNLFGQVVQGMDVVTKIRQGDVMRSVKVTEAPS
jgi:peptidyl-prolyl cis-trans isomerase B (cyclophilin B)